MPSPAKPPDSHSGSNYYFCIWGLRKCYARKQHRESVNKDGVMGLEPAHSQDPAAHVHGDCSALLGRDTEESQTGGLNCEQVSRTDRELTWAGCREEPCGNKPPRRASAA